MHAQRQIQISGYISAILFLFHIPFYWMFDWKNSLSCLSRDNWAIFHCFNIISIFLLLLMAVASIFHADEMLRTKVGRLFSLYISAFYLFRIFAEFTLFHEENIAISGAIIALCAIPGIFVTVALKSTRLR